jgi:Amidases related to nicotinamidase
LIVDVQPTFCEGGALPIAGGNACAKRIADYLADHDLDYDLVITTQDWHVDPGDHFSDDPDYIDTWPPHGIAGTQEAELHEALRDIPRDYCVKKGEFAAAYSGFEGSTPDGTSLAEVFLDEGVDHVDVVGLALSHCVKETALDAKRLHGVRVRVLRALTEPVSPEAGEEAVKELRAAGVCIV